MSGIGGALSPNGGDISEQLLLSLSDHLVYRGPFDVGVTTQKGMGFIHHNLQNLSHNTGHQPLSTASQLSLVLDGFISNYSKIKDDFLETFTFETTCPSEVIFPLYESYGAEFSQYLEGMFAAAFYDGYAKELILTRDKTGLKPLYYTWIDQQFIFSSSLKALAELHAEHKSIDAESLKENLQYGACINPATFFTDIFEVLPGQTLIVHDAKIIKHFEHKMHKMIVSSKPSLLSAEKAIQKQLEKTVLNRISELEAPSVIVNAPGDHLIAHLLQKEGITCEHKGVVIAGEQDYGGATLLAESDQVSLDEALFWRTLPFMVASIEEPCYRPELVFDYVAGKTLHAGSKNILSGFGADFVYGDREKFQRAKRFEFLGGRLVQKKGCFAPMADSPSFLSRWNGRLQQELSVIKSCSKLSKIQKSQVLAYETHMIKSGVRGYESLMATLGKETHFLFLEADQISKALGLPDAHKINHGQRGYILYDLYKRLLPTQNPVQRDQYRKQCLDAWLTRKASRIGTLVAHQPEIESLFTHDFVRSVYTCKTQKHIKCAWRLLIYALWHQAAMVGVKPVPDTLSFLSARNH